MSKIIRRRKLKLVIVLVIVICVIYIFFATLNKANYGHSIMGQLKTSYLNNQATNNNKLHYHPISNIVTSQYFSLWLPTGFVVENSPNNNPELLFYGNYLNNSAISSLIITIAITTTPVGGINNDSSFKLRETNNSYVVNNITGYRGNIWITYNKFSDGVVCFWLNNNYLATISIKSGLEQSGQYTVSETDLASSIIMNWQWH